jgi:hypothetical protein
MLSDAIDQPLVILTTDLEISVRVNVDYGDKELEGRRVTKCN